MKKKKIISLESLDGSVNSLGRRMDAFEKRMDTFEESQRKMGMLLERLETKFDLALEGFGALKRGLEHLEQRVGTLEEGMEMLGSRMGTLEGRMGVLEKRMNDGFENIDYKFEVVFERFEAVDAALSQKVSIA